MRSGGPHVVVLSGPNGAGKSTTAPGLLKGALGVRELLPSADLAVERVAERVRAGGHAVPEATVRRRYSAGLRNFFALYQPLTHTWRFYDASRAAPPRLIAMGEGSQVTRVADTPTWARIRRGVAHAG